MQAVLNVAKACKKLYHRGFCYTDMKSNNVCVNEGEGMNIILIGRCRGRVVIDGQTEMDDPTYADASAPMLIDGCNFTFVFCSRDSPPLSSDPSSSHKN